jgi:hypothetical protein
MPVVVNGRTLGVEHNGVFTDANTDPIPGGRLWVEAAASWNAMRAAYIATGGHPGDFVPAGPASSARSIAQQEVFWHAHQVNPRAPVAAFPGTSNHGWGIAVDVKTKVAAAWILTHGARYGWSWDEGKRVGEWWHFRYVGGFKAKRDPLRGYTTDEKRWIRELDKLRRERRDVGRQRVLVRELTKARKRVWRAAQPKAQGGDGRGWTELRKRRYRSLLARTR